MKKEECQALLDKIKDKLKEQGRITDARLEEQKQRL